jgi:hypothetical protein
MEPTLDQSYCRLLTLGRKALRLLVPAFMVATVPMVVASTPVGAQATPGISWSVVASPTTPPTQYNSLSGVSCSGSTFCAAVGTLNELWNGSTWSVVPSPATTDGLNGVSCSGQSACMAVGGSESEAWNGSAWSSVPVGVAGTFTTLIAVSCSGPSACMAVGNYTPNVTCGPMPPCDQIYEATLIESWNGSEWSIVPSPNAPSYPADDLTGVSCTGPSACIAVGHAGSSPAETTLIESWNGSMWSIVPSPNTSDNQPNYLTGVSCSSSTACITVGVDAVDGLENQTLIESWNGSVWSIVPSPNTSSIQNNSLSGVSCSGPSACTAVGTYTPYDPNQSSIALTLVESWNGSVWSIVPSPDPSPSSDNSLKGVSCSGSTACTAAGYLAPSALSETAQPLIESSTSISNGEAPAIISGAQADFTAGSSATFAVTSTGSPTAFLSESGAFPNGVSFIDNGDGTATLSGVPVAESAGTYPISITASNGVSPEATQSFTLTVQGPQTTSILIPSNGATLSGSTYLDASASGATSVEFLLFGGIYGYAAPVICTATPTLYGWLCSWNTTTAPNGSYVLVSKAFNSVGSTFSSGVSIKVNNPFPITSVLIPSNGATLSGSTYLDASASNATSVKLWILGGSYGFSGKMIGTATATLYGWLIDWNTTTVPDGTYALVSEAFNSAGRTFSSGVGINVKN